MSTPPVVSLAKDLRLSIRRGHPWLYDRAMAPKQPALGPGDLVIVAYRGEPLAVGYADPGRPILVRILDLDARARIDDAWVAERAFRAAQCRKTNPRLAETNAFRVIHGENDYMPGLVVDLYDDTAVVVFDGAGPACFWAPRIHALARGLADAGLAIARFWARPVKGARPGASGHAGALVGSEPPELIVIHEWGAAFEVDVRHGQKTGLFLDQRDNRRLVRELGAGGRVLNVFSYTGGFSVHAALGGARHVTSVDIAAPAMAAAERNFARNGLAVSDHAFVTEDAFAFLERGRQGERYDLVIVDPPSFAPSERVKQRGLKAYERLNRLALDLVEPGGLLMSASCSSHVSSADLLGVVSAAAQGHRTRVLEIRGAASDHPLAPAFPEGEYLNFLVVYVE